MKCHMTSIVSYLHSAKKIYYGFRSEVLIQRRTVCLRNWNEKPSQEKKNIYSRRCK